MEILNGKFLIEQLHKAETKLENGNDFMKYYQATLEFILKKGVTLQEPLAYYAVAIVLLRSNETNEKKQGIEYLEKFLQYPEPCDVYPVHSILRKVSDMFLFENNYDKSASYLDVSQNAFDDEYYVDGAMYGWDTENKCYFEVNMEEYRLAHQGANIKVGELYLKAGTQKAIDYWNNQKELIYYKTSSIFKEIVDREFSKVIKKHEQGYVYKPRIKK